MSGVNAHVILKAAADLSEPFGRVALSWQRLRLYALPPQFTMCTGAMKEASQRASFTCQLTAAKTAQVHEACFSGRPFLSVPLLLEVAASSVAQSYSERLFGFTDLVFGAIHKLVSEVACQIDLSTGMVTAGASSSVPLLQGHIIRTVDSSQADQKATGGYRAFGARPTAVSKMGSSSFAHLQFKSSEGFVCHPGHTTGALHLPLLEDPGAGLVSSMEAAMFNMRQGVHPKLTSVCKEECVSIFAPGTLGATFEHIMALKAPRGSPPVGPTEQTLYQLEWLVDSTALNAHQKYQGNSKYSRRCMLWISAHLRVCRLMRRHRPHLQLCFSTDSRMHAQKIYQETRISCRQTLRVRRYFLCPQYSAGS